MRSHIRTHSSHIRTHSPLLTSHHRSERALHREREDAAALRAKVNRYVALVDSHAHTETELQRQKVIQHASFKR